MKILVAGGAGYIGSHVARELLDCGHEVIVYDNLSNGSRDNLFGDAGFVEADILDFDRLNKSLRGVDAVIHLAAAKAAGESMENPQKYATQNICGTINLINCCIQNNVGSLVFSSSAAVYGDPQKIPIDEDHECTPVNFYGFTKYEIERILAWYSRLKPFHFAALRYFNAAGYDRAGRIKGLEKSPANLIPVVMEVACGKRTQLEVFGNDYPTEDGTCVRDYIHVSDLARAHVSALEWIKRTARDLVINLGTGAGYSVAQVIDMSRKVTGKPIAVVQSGRRAGDPTTLIASAQRAHAVLGWKPTESDLATIIETSWAQYKNR